MNLASCINKMIQASRFMIQGYLFSNERQDRHNSGAFDGVGYFSLMLRAKAGALFGDYARVAGYIFLEKLDIFIVRFLGLIDAKMAHFRRLQSQWCLFFVRLPESWFHI